MHKLLKVTDQREAKGANVEFHKDSEITAEGLLF